MVYHASRVHAHSHRASPTLESSRLPVKVVSGTHTRPRSNSNSPQQQMGKHRPSSPPRHPSSKGSPYQTASNGIVYSTPSPARSRLSMSRNSYSGGRRRDPPMSKDEGTATTTERLCDYDTNATTLYELLESSNWAEARSRCRTHPEEVRTWIVRKDNALNVRWKLLPLHAAIIFQSPSFLVAALLEKYTTAASRKDDQGMLPLHLAFRHKNDDEELLELLLVQNPKAVMAKDRRDRVPLEHGRDSNFSAKLMRLYADATVAASRALNTKTSSDSHTAISSARALDFSDERARLKEDHERKMASSKKDFSSRMAEQKRLYEERIGTLREHNSVNVRQMELAANDERESMLEKHQEELNEVRELLHNQVSKDREQVKRLRKELENLQALLEESKLQQEHASAQHGQLQAAYDELRENMEFVADEQLQIRSLSLQQQDEQETQRASRQQAIENLSRLVEADFSGDRRRTKEVLTISDSIRTRISNLLDERHAAGNGLHAPHAGDQRYAPHFDEDDRRQFEEDGDLDHREARDDRYLTRNSPTPEEGRRVTPIVVGEQVDRPPIVAASSGRNMHNDEQNMSRVERERQQNESQPEGNRRDYVGTREPPETQYRNSSEKPIEVQAEEYYAEVPSSPTTTIRGDQPNHTKESYGNAGIVGDDISAITDTSAF